MEREYHGFWGRMHKRVDKRGMKKMKQVPVVDREAFEKVIGRLLEQTPKKRSEAKTGTRKKTAKVIPPKP